MTELAEMQYEMNGLLLGRGTPYHVSKVDFGTPDMVLNDGDRPREDGERFGRDYRKGRTIIFDAHVLTNGHALDAIDVLEAAWLADDIRDIPGAVTTLRMRRGGRTRIVWGRPRKLAVTTGTTLSGWAPFTAEFRTDSHLYYDDVEQSTTVTLVPPQGGGVVSPVVAPVTTVAESNSRQGDIVVGGTVPTWMVFEIRGPITNPTIGILSRWSVTLNITLASDNWVTIDPRPWSRSVRTRFGDNAAGAFTPTSPKLSDLRLPPGPATVTLRGTDPTGTASMTARWRNAYASF